VRTRQLITLLLVFLATAPVAGIALWSIGRTVMELSDPCAEWGHPPGQPAYMHVGPQDPCRALSVHSESKARAVIIAVLVPGGVLVAAMLAMAGVALSRRKMMWTAAIGMLAETLVAFTIAPLTLLAGVSVLLLAKRLQPSP
jgi:hypothetical protein